MASAVVLLQRPPVCSVPTDLTPERPQEITKKLLRFPALADLLPDGVVQHCRLQQPHHQQAFRCAQTDQMMLADAGDLHGVVVNVC